MADGHNFIVKSPTVQKFNGSLRNLIWYNDSFNPLKPYMHMIKI